jgi:predicted Fe-S protein YdhL (DUF1289 family)
MIIICPHCRLKGDDDDPGDLKMCTGCGRWSRLEGKTLHKLTADEQENVAAAFDKFLKATRR